MKPPSISVRDLNLTQRGRAVLDEVSLDLYPGDFVGLIGPNGAGKTTFLKVLLGLIRPDSGSVKILGLPPRRAYGQIGYVPQYANFQADFPIRVLDVVLMGRLNNAPCFSSFKTEDMERARELLAQLNLAGYERRQIGELSGGEIQRVLIARALAGNPKVLLLDEPMASLDSLIGKNIYDLLGELSEEMTILLVSHDIGVISTYVKTIACLNKKLHYHGSRELSGDVIQEVYGCPVELIAHGHAHRVLAGHEEESS